jgi:cytochrome c oxidase subunit 3
VSDRPRSNDPSCGAESDSAPQVNAGGLGMVALIAALSSFFAASIVVYLLMRQMHQPWPPAGFPALPSSLWVSTLAILFASVTMQGAVLAARRGDSTGLRRNLAATLVLGLGFLGLQSYAWYTVWRQVAAVAGLDSSYLKMFYVMTGLHAAHVLGGLVPLVMVTIAVYLGRYGRKRNAAVRYTAVYWHFLDAVWCVIFLVVYLL